jgi:hypothetical protein
MANRDGYRGNLDTAEHEAAHAVIGILVGHRVHKVSIAPSKAERDHTAGYCFSDLPGAPWPIRLHPHHEAITGAAGAAQELLEVFPLSRGLTRWSEARRIARLLHKTWYCSGSDRRNVGTARFLPAVVVAYRMLIDSNVQAAVADVAQRMRRSKSGEAYGGTIEKIMHRHGLTPAPDLNIFTGAAMVRPRYPAIEQARRPHLATCSGCRNSEDTPRQLVQRVWLTESHTPSRACMVFTCAACTLDGIPLVDFGRERAMTCGFVEDTGRTAWAELTVPQRRARVATWRETELVG